MVLKRQRILFAGVTALILSIGAVASARETMEFTPSQKSHWAWKRPVRPAVPQVRNRQWVANPTDAFILAKLEAKGLKPAPTASRETLIRRVAYDLIGLPPTPAELDAFLQDTAPGAYARMVDRYLASPQYGERWARHWLDLARYADSNGYEYDEMRPDMWRYRDYVVRSFNADKPYPQFILEQLAGDELSPHDPDARIATGFNLLGADMTDSADQPGRRQNTLNDMTDTTALVFLGLTLGCARCHNHKYEPLSQQDYYRFQAFFSPTRFRKDIPVGTPEQLAAHARAEADYQAKVQQLEGRIDAVVGPARQQLRAAALAKLPEDVQTAFRTGPTERTVEQQMIVQRNEALIDPAPKALLANVPTELRPKYEALESDLRALEKRRPVPPAMAVGLEDAPDPAPKTYLLERGELSNKAEEVTPGYPVILTGAAPARGSRTDLARWIASAENPLTARVMVNRVWQHHFGRGILPSPSDFGVRGDDPTHPALLDWLAVQFTEKWSVKDLHRLILNSNAYKQSSFAPAQALAKDPENQLFSRFPRVRLEAEAIRDGALAVSGRLNRKMGGPGVFPPLPAGLKVGAGQWPVSPNPSDHVRRSLYIFARRNLRFPSLETFDSPDTNLSCARREASTTAPQALELLNAPEMQECARGFAGRVLEGAKGDDERIALAYRLAFSRKPTPEELKLGREFLARQSETLLGHDATGVAAWTDYSLALLNLNEFIYLD